MLGISTARLTRASSIIGVRHFNRRTFIREFLSTIVPLAQPTLDPSFSWLSVICGDTLHGDKREAKVARLADQAIQRSLIGDRA